MIQQTLKRMATVVRCGYQKVRVFAKNIWRNIWGLAAVPDIEQGRVVPDSLVQVGRDDVHVCCCRR